MNGQVNGPQGTQGEAEAATALDAGSALDQVLAAVSALRAAPVTAAGPAGAGGGPLSGPQVLAALTLLRELRAEIAGWEPELIEAARRRGTSWVELAPALGVASRQAAERRFLRLRPSATPGPVTGEQRVTAERDRRAGDRAARAWARDNAAGLRQLAGQISALTDLPRGAAHDVAAVRHALGGDDAADLLGPLEQARPHLEAGHPGLAEAIGAVDENTRRARRDARHRTAD
ncbi:HSP18 transcriptional regulator [Catenulispora pinisilvae]|uniref:HSP18 transcriptional regulator n=1 Tax=Catenulispora pinisilvae TaxID=2705253 RepID=UPI002B270928|nr:HSP18 transcriptional regulator [Catenulispora pinisilvae]